MSFTPADERAHVPGPEPWWQETWVFDFWTDDGLGGFTWLTLLNGLRRAWYWAALVQPGRPLLYLADVDVPLPTTGLELRSEGLWASHDCEAPFEQWTVANEAYAVALEHPDEALGRGYGRPEPVAFDIEWYAASPAVALSGTSGYAQAGTVDAVIELGQGRLEVEASSRRRHWWGRPPVGEPAEGLRVALRLGEDPYGAVVVRALGIGGWHEWRTASLGT
jgi:hypothetical protein